jgi:hypothetical protein
MHIQQLQQFMPDRTNVKHGCLGGRVNQDVQIAAFLVIAIKHLAENSGLAGAVPQHHAANRCAVSFKGNRWSHRAFSKVGIQLGHISAYIRTSKSTNEHSLSDETLLAASQADAVPALCNK